jgi:MerR family transcriptional regulator, light-induced transcriptional regulator
MEKWISPQLAAQRLGISTSTFKRFCDANNVPLVRTPGGHRRIDECQLEVVSRLLRSLSDPNESDLTVPEVVSMLLAGDHVQLTDRFWTVSQSPSLLANLLEDILVPALWKVGDLWQQKEIDTANEKVCSTTAGLVIDNLIGRFPAPSGRTYVGASFPPSLDTLASKLVTLSLLSINVRGIQLGCSVSPDIIANAVRLYDAEAVWISHTHVTKLEQVVADHERLHELLPEGTRIVIGGGGLAPSLRRMLPNCIYYESVELWIKAEREAV